MRLVTANKKQVLQRLIAADGILNMHERAEKAGMLCKLNGVKRRLNMAVIDCGTAACLHGSCSLNPWFQERGYPKAKDSGNGDDDGLPEFWGAAYPAIYNIFGFGQDIWGACDSGPYKGKELKSLSIDDVRAPLRALIREYGGQDAIDECERRRAEGDELKHGISDQPISKPTVED